VPLHEISLGQTQTCNPVLAEHPARIYATHNVRLRANRVHYKTAERILRGAYNDARPGDIKWAHYIYSSSMYSFYMLIVADLRKNRRRAMSPGEQAPRGIDKLNIARSENPAVTHVDYSVRIQTVHANTKSAVPPAAQTHQRAAYNFGVGALIFVGLYWASRSPRLTALHC
jgi:hypothetical protein